MTYNVFSGTLNTTQSNNQPWRQIDAYVRPTCNTAICYSYLLSTCTGFHCRVAYMQQLAAMGRYVALNIIVSHTSHYSKF